MKSVLTISLLVFKKHGLVLLFSLLLFLICFLNNRVRYNFWVSLTSFIIIIISITGIFRLDGKPFSLNKVFYLFILFFYGIAPIAQFKNDIVIWSSAKIKFSTNDFIFTNLIIIGVLLFYNIFYKIFSKIKFKKIINLTGSDLYKKKINWVTGLLVISFFSFAMVLYFAGFNIFTLLLRGSRGVEVSSMVGLLLDYFVRPVPVICLILFKLNGGKDRLAELLLWIVILLCDFPTGLPRLQIAAFYLPILFIYFISLRKYFVFSLILMFGLLFLFPFFDMFRVLNFNAIKQGGEVVIFNYNMFLLGHFDNYQNFLRILKYDIVTEGSQLMGVLLFFIPRSLWPTKPVNSGLVIFEKLHLYWDNISVNYFAEGYINFGFIGILLFVIFLAYINARMDHLFWNIYHGNLYTNTFYSSIYLVLLGSEFFIMRGTLMAAFPITLGLIVSIYLISRLIGYR